MTTVLAIDPGNRESAYALIDANTCRPLYAEKLPNDDLMYAIRQANLGYSARWIAIEMVASYGMTVGVEVFDTCVWIGRYYEALHRTRWATLELIPRKPVKLHHCQDSRAKDSNITQALVDRFTPGASNYGKGSKANPGWFYGFKADVWQAYALAVYVADTRNPTSSAPVLVPEARTGTDTTAPAESGDGGPVRHPNVLGEEAAGCRTTPPTTSTVDVTTLLGVPR